MIFADIVFSSVFLSCLRSSFFEYNVLNIFVMLSRLPILPSLTTLRETFGLGMSIDLPSFKCCTCMRSGVCIIAMFEPESDSGGTVVGTKYASWYHGTVMVVARIVAGGTNPFTLSV